MIWGNVKYIDHYKGISHALDVALDYLAAGDFKELENGKLDLEAGVFVKLLDQGLKNSRDWEAHKNTLIFISRWKRVSWSLLWRLHWFQDGASMMKPKSV